MTPRPPPIQEGLDQLSNDFSYHLLWGAKKLRRGELLLAKQVYDCYLTERRWAGEAAPEAVRPTFAHYEAADIGRALCAPKASSTEPWKTTSRRVSDSPSRSIAARSSAAWTH
jgi:hypothetical protein